MNPSIGTMQCPLSVVAGNPHEATIHQQNSRRKPMYWRCACGTMQPLTESGQLLMQAVTQTAPADPPRQEKPAQDPKPAKDPKPASEPPAPAKKKGGAIDFLFGGDDDE